MNITHTAAYWIERAQTRGLDAVADLSHFRDLLGVPRGLDDHNFFTRGRRPKTQERIQTKQMQERLAMITAQQAASSEAFTVMLADGRLRRLTRRERLERIGAGHDDNESVQAARRILAQMDTTAATRQERPE